MRMIRLHDRTKLTQAQEGVVSLLVTMVLMIVISLIALGFAQVARRNQGEEIDQQLSTQAFYAAESGVNDATQIVSTYSTSPYNYTASELTRANCAGPTSDGYQGIYTSLNTNNSLSTTNGQNISYTCVLINPDPGAIQTQVGTTSKIIPINAATATNINQIKLTWSTEQQGDTGAANACPATAQLPTAAAFDTCGMGVLRVDLVPVDNAAPTNATTFAKETLTFFAVPMRPTAPGSIGTVNYEGANSSTANPDNIVGVACGNTTPNCSVTINTAAYAHQAYELRVSSEYENSGLTITANNGTLGLTGAQVVVDATGKAQDVVRRIQVYVPIGIVSNQLSDYAIESTDSLCKRYVVMNGYYASEMGSTNVQTNNGALDPLCQ